MLNPAQDALPGFFDPLLDYLSTTLPPPLYSFLINVLTHTFAAITAIARLSASMLLRNPSEWDAQTLLPPIITILAAYLALASLYRTTTWAFRMGFWFMKWGTLISLIMAGAGYFMGNAGDAVGNHGAAVLGNIFSSLVGGESTPKRNRQAKSQRRTKKNKPKAWDSFERHKEWQYDEHERQDANPQAQQIMNMVADAAGKIFESGSWWGAVKNLGKDSTPSEEDGKEPKVSKKGKGRAGNSRSR